MLISAGTFIETAIAGILTFAGGLISGHHTDQKAFTDKEIENLKAQCIPGQLCEPLNDFYKTHDGYPSVVLKVKAQPVQSTPTK